MNINIPQQDYSIKDGLMEVRQFMKRGYITDLLGLPVNTISLAIAGQRGGRSYHLPWVHVPRINKVLQQTSEILFSTRITREAQTKEQSPLAYGENEVEQVKQLGKCLLLPNLFENEMRKNKAWYANRFRYTDLSSCTACKDADLQEINEAILRLAMRMARIRLVLPPEVDSVQENY